ncbi:uncharacterized protein N7473_012381 [Penicillium subrubescens]|uniref:uncharacterized protein n=1 Tax=Penicillium subrubescens TaxID=1316194 RepID=UPI0025455D7C|nr:uncharacterized protein N7473_012381 [Penicillium subrubescens]KAJ5881328.1 hypothetical protein N7473_012381 [Penicillium subrubescens]
MSASCSLPRFPSHFMAPLPVCLDSPPSSTQYIPHTSTVSTRDSRQTSTSKRRSRKTETSSSPSSASTENRVSKAKKGKRVHACEYPGCTKIFTRAEHRRRHELSHKSMKSHTCSYIGCHKSFHRADYLAQHMARHGGDFISPRKRHTSLIKTEPAAYSLTNPSISRSHSASPIGNDFQSLKSGVNEPMGLSIGPCLQCFNCQSNQQCEGQGAYFSDYTTAMDQSRVSPVPSSSGLIANNAPNTPFPQAGFDSVIETYMRNMLRPEAFITPQQSLSPPAQLQEPVNATFWDPNIDPNLPPLNPAVFENDTTYSTWPSSNVDTTPSITTHRHEG